MCFNIDWTYFLKKIRQLRIHVVCCHPPWKPVGMEFGMEYDTLIWSSNVIRNKEDAKGNVLHYGLDSFQAITDKSIASKHQTTT